MSAMPAEGSGRPRPEPGSDASTAEIQDDIDRTRNELGDTAEALAAKLDVQTRVQERVEDTKKQIADRTEPVRRNAVPITASAVTVVVVIGALRRRRRRRRDAA